MSELALTVTIRAEGASDRAAFDRAADLLLALAHRLLLVDRAEMFDTRGDAQAVTMWGGQRRGQGPKTTATARYVLELLQQGRPAWLPPGGGLVVHLAPGAQPAPAGAGIPVELPIGIPVALPFAGERLDRSEANGA